jgi:hypothetical protein
MSDREKKLLIFFAIAGFAIVNFLAYGYAQSKRIQVNAQLEDARLKLKTAEGFRESREQVSDQMDWLAEHEPEPVANQDAQTALQKLADSEAKSKGLTIKAQKPLPSDTTPGRHYHRAKLQITVIGTEEALYAWLDSLNMPDQFRIATKINLSPDKTDDTKIDCTAIIEQWFVPKTS